MSQKLNEHFRQRTDGKKRKDLRKYSDTYITQLYKLPDGSKFRHCVDDLICIKDSDAVQHVIGGRDVIFARRDLVEVLK